MRSYQQGHTNERRQMKIEYLLTDKSMKVPPNYIRVCIKKICQIDVGKSSFNYYKTKCVLLYIKLPG